MLKACAKCGGIHEWGVCPRGVYTVHRQKTRGKTERFRSSAIWMRKRDQILERDKHVCLLCLAEGRFNDRQLEVHHITPLADDWSLRLEDSNLVTLCKYHHQLVHSDEKAAGMLKELNISSPRENFKPWL